MGSMGSIQYSSRNRPFCEGTHSCRHVRDDAQGSFDPTPIASHGAIGWFVARPTDRRRCFPPFLSCMSRIASKQLMKERPNKGCDPTRRRHSFHHCCCRWRRTPPLAKSSFLLRCCADDDDFLSGRPSKRPLGSGFVPSQTAVAAARSST